MGPGAQVKEVEKAPWEISRQETWPQSSQQNWSQPHRSQVDYPQRNYQNSSEQGSRSRQHHMQPPEHLAGSRPGTRIDPEDNKQRTFAEVWQKYSHFFSEKEVLEYWDGTCKPEDGGGGAATAANGANEQNILYEMKQMNNIL